jgi:hypothetical protein
VKPSGSAKWPLNRNDYDARPGKRQRFFARALAGLMLAESFSIHTGAED